MSTPVHTCPTHQALLAAAARCEQAAVDRFDGAADVDGDGRPRAREILRLLAAQCRTVAEVFTLDPTLADEPGSGLWRPIDLFAELVRQTRTLLGQAVGVTGLDRWPRQDRWDEAEQLFTRATQLAQVIPQVVPRRDHDTVDGSQAISADRLAAQSRRLRDAADTARAATVAAARLPYPHPQVGAVLTLADELTAIADALDTQHVRVAAALHACGLVTT